MIRPIGPLALSLRERRRERIHHNILSGVVDRAELIRGLPNTAAADSIRADGRTWTTRINKISTNIRFLLATAARRGRLESNGPFDRSRESIDIKNAIMVQFSPNRIFTAAIILLRYAPLSPSPSLSSLDRDLLLPAGVACA